MGKTIQIIALLVTANTRPNLVIAYVAQIFSWRVLNLTILFARPTVAVMQWRNEIEAHTDGMKVLVWHGSSRESDIEKLKKFDVVCHCCQCRAKLPNDEILRS